MKPVELTPADKLAKVVEIFVNEIGPLTTVMMVQVFITAASLNDHVKGVGMKEIERRLGLFSSTTTRNVQAMGTRYDKTRTKGAGLIEVLDDPKDASARLVFLTPKGRRLWERIQEILG